MSSRVRHSHSDIIMVASGLSLLLHLGLGGGMSLLSRFTPSANPDDVSVTPIEWMDIRDAKSSKTQTILPKVEVPKSMRIENDNKPSKFMSAETVRVREESKARFIPGSESMNSEQSSPRTQSQFQPKIQSPGSKVTSPTPNSIISESTHRSSDPSLKKLKLFDNSASGDVAINTSSEEHAESPSGSGSTPITFAPPSQLSIDLPDEIKVGSMTVLNSDSSIYFSYFDRMQRLIYYRWVKNVDETMSWLLLKNRLPSTSMVYSTVDEIVLDSSGNFLRAHTLLPSGLQEVDDAVENAFSQARIIPNPPEGLIKQGLVRFKVRFDIYYHPSYARMRR